MALLWIAIVLLVLSILSLVGGLTLLKGKSIFDFLFEIMPFWPLVLTGNYKDAFDILKANKRFLLLPLAQLLFVSSIISFLGQVLFWIIQAATK